MKPRHGIIIGVALAAFGAGGLVGSVTTTPSTQHASYSTDHQLIVQLAHANDSMQHACHGYSALEMKADGTTEIVGHCR